MCEDQIRRSRSDGDGRGASGRRQACGGRRRTSHPLFCQAQRPIPDGRTISPEHLWKTPCPETQHRHGAAPRRAPGLSPTDELGPRTSRLSAGLPANRGRAWMMTKTQGGSRSLPASRPQSARLPGSWRWRPPSTLTSSNRGHRTARRAGLTTRPRRDKSGARLGAASAYKVGPRNCTPHKSC